MSFSRLYSGCRKCPYRDTCQNKRLEAVAYLKSETSAFSGSWEENRGTAFSSSLSEFITNILRDIKIDENNNDELKRQMTDFHKQQRKGFCNR